MCGTYISTKSSTLQVHARQMYSLNRATIPPDPDPLEAVGPLKGFSQLLPTNPTSQEHSPLLLHTYVKLVDN